MTTFYPWMTERVNQLTPEQKQLLAHIPEPVRTLTPRAEASYNQRIYKQDHKPLVIFKPRPADYVSEWDRVLNMRRTNDPLILGGNHIDNRIIRDKLKFGIQKTVSEKRKTGFFHREGMNSIMHKD